jgi:CheY-like chemotaxis protein
MNPEHRKQRTTADDNAAIRQLLDELLQEDGYTVISTANGRQRVPIAQQQIPDLNSGRSDDAANGWL